MAIEIKKLEHWHVGIDNEGFTCGPRKGADGRFVCYEDAVAREDALIEAMKKAMSDMYDVIRRIKETR